MPGSTGVKSSVFSGAPATQLEEDSRVQSGSIASMPGIQSSVQQVVGLVREVHESAPMIKAVLEDGTLIANGQWIPLSHSLNEIVERFGTIRKNMTVLVVYTGAEGSDALATILSAGASKPGAGAMYSNEVKKGLYFIFAPGLKVV